MKKVKRFMYIQSIVGFQLFFGSIMTLYYLKYSIITLSQVFIIESILGLSIACFEIPTGRISDKFGRKNMLLLSIFGMILVNIVLILTKSYSWLIVNTIISGFFTAISSGTDESLYYDYFNTYSNKDELEKTYSKTSSITFISTIIATASVGFIFNYSMTLPLVIDSVIMFILVVIGIITLPSDNFVKKEKIGINQHTIKKSNKEIYIKELKNALPIFLIVSIIFVSIRMSYSMYQPIIVSVGVNVTYLGIVLALFNILSSCSAYYSTRFFKLIGTEKKVLFIFAILLGISFLGVLLIRNLFIFVFLAIQQIVRGIFPVLSIKRNYYISQNCEVRTTVLSIANAFNAGIFCIMLLLQSLLLKFFDIYVVLFLAGSFAVLLLVFVSIIYFKLKKKGEIVCYQEE